MSAHDDDGPAFLQGDIVALNDGRTFDVRTEERNGTLVHYIVDPRKKGNTRKVTLTPHFVARSGVTLRQRRAPPTNTPEVTAQRELTERELRRIKTSPFFVGMIGGAWRPAEGKVLGLSTLADFYARHIFPRLSAKALQRWATIDGLAFKAVINYARLATRLTLDRYVIPELAQAFSSGRLTHLDAGSGLPRFGFWFPPDITDAEWHAATSPDQLTGLLLANRQSLTSVVLPSWYIEEAAWRLAAPRMVALTSLTVTREAFRGAGTLDVTPLLFEHARPPHLDTVHLTRGEYTVQPPPPPLPPAGSPAPNSIAAELPRLELIGLSGPFPALSSLHLPKLTDLTVSDSPDAHVSIIGLLGALTSLRHLHLRVGTLLPHPTNNLPAAAPSLQSLTIRSPYSMDTGRNFPWRALPYAPNLTALALPDLEAKRGWDQVLNTRFPELRDLLVGAISLSLETAGAGASRESYIFRRLTDLTALHATGRRTLAFLHAAAPALRRLTVPHLQALAGSAEDAKAAAAAEVAAVVPFRHDTLETITVRPSGELALFIRKSPLTSLAGASLPALRQLRIPGREFKGAVAALTDFRGAPLLEEVHITASEIHDRGHSPEPEIRLLQASLTQAIGRPVAVTYGHTFMYDDEVYKIQHGEASGWVQEVWSTYAAVSQTGAGAAPPLGSSGAVPSSSAPSLAFASSSSASGPPSHSHSYSHGPPSRKRQRSPQSLDDPDEEASAASPSESPVSKRSRRDDGCPPEAARVPRVRLVAGEYILCVPAQLLVKYSPVMKAFLKGEWRREGMYEPGLLWTYQVPAEVTPWSLRALFAALIAMERKADPLGYRRDIAPEDLFGLLSLSTLLDISRLEEALAKLAGNHSGTIEYSF